MSTDDKFGIADRLRDSAALIKDQIGGQEGDAVFLDLDLLADEIEEMEISFEDKGAGFLTFSDGDDLEGIRNDLLTEGVDLLKQVVQSSIMTPSKNRQQANKK